MTADLTRGPIRRQMIALALPLLASNIFQQLYNTVDVAIVGRYVGEEAFAAVGVAGSVMNLFLFLITGCCNGVGALLSQSHGAGDGDSFRREFFLASVFGGVASLALAALAALILPFLLAALRTPQEIAAPAAVYLRVIFLGFLPAFAYQLGFAVLRSVGNTAAALGVFGGLHGGEPGAGYCLCGGAPPGHRRGGLGHGAGPDPGGGVLPGVSPDSVFPPGLSPGGYEV